MSKRGFYLDGGVEKRDGVFIEDNGTLAGVTSLNVTVVEQQNTFISIGMAGLLGLTGNIMSSLFLFYFRHTQLSDLSVGAQTFSGSKQGFHILFDFRKKSSTFGLEFSYESHVMDGSYEIREDINKMMFYIKF